MLIRCPTCASGYELAPDLLTDGRILRCANCRDAWVYRGTAIHGDAGDHVDGPEIVVEAIASRWPPADGPGPARRSAPWLRPPLPRPPAGAAASLLAAALLAGGLAGVAGRARVVAAFPPSEAVFATLGLPVNLTGLAFGGVRSAVAEGDGAPVLTLDGRIRNVGADGAAVPGLRIAVRDKDGRELYHWTAPPPKARLAAGETVPFHGRLEAPPRDGCELAVSFARPAPDRRRVAEIEPR